MPNSSNSSRFIPIHKLSALLGIPLPTLRRWEKNDSMPASTRFGGRIRYWKISILKRWIATLTSLPKEMQAEVWQGLETAAHAGCNNTKNNQDKS